MVHLCELEKSTPSGQRSPRLQPGEGDKDGILYLLDPSLRHLVQRGKLPSLVSRAFMGCTVR